MFLWVFSHVNNVYSLLLVFISSSFSFWTYPRMSCDELLLDLIKFIGYFCLYAVFKVRCDNVSCFRLSAQETSFLSLTDILRIYVHRPANPSLYAQVRNAFLCCTAQAIRFIIKWRWRDSNSWPPACKAGALPTELHPHWVIGFIQFTTGLTVCQTNGLKWTRTTDLTLIRRAL